MGLPTQTQKHAKYLIKVLNLLQNQNKYSILISKNTWLTFAKLNFLWIVPFSSSAMIIYGFIMSKDTLLTFAKINFLWIVPIFYFLNSLGYTVFSRPLSHTQLVQNCAHFWSLTYISMWNWLIFYFKLKSNIPYHLINAGSQVIACFKLTPG
jgi:hypothetical protein